MQQIPERYEHLPRLRFNDTRDVTLPDGTTRRITYVVSPWYPIIVVGQETIDGANPDVVSYNAGTRRLHLRCENGAAEYDLSPLTGALYLGKLLWSEGGGNRWFDPRKHLKQST